MKAIQLNQLQLEALSNGATALLFVIDKSITIKGEIQSEEDVAYGVEFIKDHEWTECTLNHFISQFSLLQPNQEYYIQEEFFLWKYESGVKVCFEVTNEEQNHFAEWKLASQMTYEQSRYKFTVKSAEVKRVGSLTHNERICVMGHEHEPNNNCPCNYTDSPCDTCWNFDLEKENLEYFECDIDEQYGQGTYAKNPYCFYAVIEKD